VWTARFPSWRSVRESVRRRVRSFDHSEPMDWLADGVLAKALQIPGYIQARNNSVRFGAHDVTKMLAIAFAYAHAEEVDGDYAEFGVFKGRTFVEAYRVAQKYSRYERRFVAFDSFEGLPELGDIDRGPRWRAGEFDCDRTAFEARLSRARIPAERVTIVEGFFDRTLAAPERIPLDRVAIAWVDCDLYESTVPVLDYLTDRLLPGAVLAFDDWYCFRGARDKGECRACAEWLERNPQIELVGWRDFKWAGRAFLVQRDPLSSMSDQDRPPSSV